MTQTKFRSKVIRFRSFRILSLREVVLLIIGLFFGSKISIPHRNSTQAVPTVFPSLSKSLSILPTTPINPYNAHIITQCPPSSKLSTGHTALGCSSKCTHFYTTWSPKTPRPEDASQPHKMRAHIAEDLMSQYPMPIDILDIGANTGQVTFAALLQEKDHRVLAVEPVQRNLNRLCRIAQLNSWLNSPSLTLVHAAASDRVANQTIFVPRGREDNAALSADAATLNVRKRKGEEHIFLLDGDGLLQETGFRPKLIKIDTQGHELFVLRGLRRYLTNAARGEVLVMAELDEGLTRASNVDIIQVYELMVEELGYTAYCSPQFDLDDRGMVLRSAASPVKKAEFPPSECSDAYYVKF